LEAIESLYISSDVLAKSCSEGEGVRRFCYNSGCELKWNIVTTPAGQSMILASNCTELHLNLMRLCAAVPFVVSVICGKNRPICGQHEQVVKKLKGVSVSVKVLADRLG
jgi:hypothetical protein